MSPEPASAPGTKAPAGTKTADADVVRIPRPAGGPGRGGPFGGMNIPAEKAMNFGASAKRLLGTLRPERAWLTLVLLMAVAGVVLQVIGPRLLGEGTNLIFSGVVSKELPAGVTQEQLIAQLRAAGDNQKADMLSAMTLTPGAGIDFAALGSVLTWALVLYVLASAFMWGQAYVLNGVVQRTVFGLREEIEAKINRLPLKYFDSIQRGELLSRVTNDVDNISQSLQQSISQAVTSVLSVVGVLVMMFILSPTLALIALVTIPLTLGITALIAKRSQKLFVAQWKNTGQLNGQIEETYTGHALVKVFGRQREVGEQFRQKNQELYEASFGAQFISGLIMPAMTFIGNLVYVGIAVVGGLQVASGAMQLGDVQAFIQYSRQFTQPLAQLGSMANLLQSGVASAERVFELLDTEEQSADPAGSGLAGAGAGAGALGAAASSASGDAYDGGRAVRGRLEFEEVSFAYSPDKPLITGLSLVAEPGQTVAIVGPTGAGKTTLVNLMMRFYELDAGRITLDGVDITTMSRHDLRSRMGMVLQDTWLFGGTIRDNIAYGRPGASEGEILEAAQATYVDRFVHSLPDGYDTVLDDEGSNVSAGEKQLLTIARAFLARPSVLILDEATSSVDTRTEVLVQKAMSALRSDRTSFVIAHRLSTIRDADLILVMEAGQIVEQGTHASLLAAGGAYARLYEAQFAAPAAEV
ncbi:ABC transporter ATP-binding protein [Pseudarthrobacter sp. SL88]|uniref:ABC transporter ATP-binding protein n=1 Tax=Pseudarthrobacter sp. SL88 TaxID=2994666 RepID=UPI002DD4268A|nr:ABC transporter ATP-binding protein [Pseudarthrobacter sp. SL88]